MIESLLTLSANELSDLSAALRSTRLSPPYTSIGLQRVIPEDSAAPVAAIFQDLETRGLNPLQIALMLDMVIQDRHSHPRLEDQIDLVTTGPECSGVENRDTSVVVRELFANANKSVLVAGFAIYQGHLVFQALAERKQELPQLQIRVFCDIQRPMGDTSLDVEIVRRFADRFRSQQWPPSRPLPEVFFDPRSLVLGGDKRACMHAKCIVVDNETVFISSANFTEAAQHRNIEVGLLVRCTAIAERLTRFFDTMEEEQLLERLF